MKKKNYNPFRMLGSWMGAVAGIIFGNLIRGNMNFFELSPFHQLTKFTIDGLLAVNLIRLEYLIYGFLVGWGIHSLVRYLKK